MKSKTSTQNIQWLMQSPIGPLYLVASSKGLQGIFWKKKSIPMANSLKDTAPEIKILVQSVSQLTAYFNGKLQKFNIPLDIEGTPFQKQVWQQLNKIPFGKTCAYKDIAIKIKNPKAVRAVGTANGSNPICIIIPCHRVIAADGSIGGYAGGLSIKRQLLALEKQY